MRSAWIAAAVAALVAASGLYAQSEAQPEAKPEAQPPQTSSPSFPVEFELGYRFVDVSGNDDMYRTQINERPGVLLRSLTWASTGPLEGGLLDYFRVDASDVGAGPAGSLRLAAGPGRPLPARLQLAAHRSLQRAPGVREPATRRRNPPGPAHLRPHARHLRRDPPDLPGEDADADPRLHAQHLPGPRHDHLPHGRERLPPERGRPGGRRRVPGRARLQYEDHPGRRDAGVPSVPPPGRRVARPRRRRRQHLLPDPGTDGHRGRDRPHDELQDELSRDQRLGHRPTPRSPHADRQLHPGRRQRLLRLDRDRHGQLRLLRDLAPLHGSRRHDQLLREDELLAGIGARGLRIRRRPRRDGRLDREEPRAHGQRARQQPLPRHDDLRQRRPRETSCRPSRATPRSTATIAPST